MESPMITLLYCRSPQRLRNWQQSQGEGEAEDWALVVNLFKEQVKSHIFNSRQPWDCPYLPLSYSANAYSKFESLLPRRDDAEEFRTSDTGAAGRADGSPILLKTVGSILSLEGYFNNKIDHPTYILLIFVHLTYTCHDVSPPVLFWTSSSLSTFSQYWGAQNRIK